MFLTLVTFCMYTSESMNARACVIGRAKCFWSCCPGTLHNIKDPPQHRAGQSPIWHLGHEQPNAQPVRADHIKLKWKLIKWIFSAKMKTSGEFLTSCFWVHVRQLWGRDDHIPAAACPKTESVHENWIHQHQSHSHTGPSDHWRNTMSFWEKQDKTCNQFCAFVHIKKLISLLYWPYDLSYAFDQLSVSCPVVGL